MAGGYVNGVLLLVVLLFVLIIRRCSFYHVDLIHVCCLFVDKFGRKPSTILAAIVFATGGLLMVCDCSVCLFHMFAQGLAPDFWVLLAARLIAGQRVCCIVLRYHRVH